jgi:hypothetical protein
MSMDALILMTLEGAATANGNADPLMTMLDSEIVEANGSNNAQTALTTTGGDSYAATHALL